MKRRRAPRITEVEIHTPTFRTTGGEAGAGRKRRRTRARKAKTTRPFGPTHSGSTEWRHDGGSLAPYGYAIGRDRKNRFEYYGVRDIDGVRVRKYSRRK